MAYSNVFLDASVNAAFGSGTHTAILLNGAAILPTDTLATVLSREVKSVGGYTRFALPAISGGGFSPAFSSTIAIPYTGVAIIKNGRLTPNVGCTVDTTTNIITTASALPTLVDGDKVSLSFDPGGFLPASTPGITTATDLYVDVLSTTTFRVYTDLALTSLVDFTSVGSLVRFNPGGPGAYWELASQAIVAGTVPASGTSTINVFVQAANG